jgi:hypothetical protein
LAVWWRLLLLAFGAFGCSNDARDSVAESPAGCGKGRSALRLWNFNLSHPDTVTLKNTSTCPMDLEGIELSFDDRDDAFPDTLIDCTVRLPHMELSPGASVRVSELPLRGEIDALSFEISGCSYPLTFHQDRGAVLYLCDGACDARTVLDVVAHKGDDVDGLEPGVVENRFREPSPIRYAAKFPEPLQGQSKFNDGFVRYQRIATDGVHPNFLASDWGLQSRTLFADFEDGVRVRNVAAPPEPWTVVPGEPAEIVVSPSTAASFAASLRITHLGEDGPSDALAWKLDAFSVPRDLTYFVRSSSEGAIAGNLALLAQSKPIVELGFAPGGVGATDGAGRRAETAAARDTWYRIELRDIDWTRGLFDAYVDGIRIGHELALASAKDGLFDELRLYDVSAESSAHFDAVELWGPPYAVEIPDTNEPGMLRCGASGEPATDVEGPTCEDIDGPSTLAATCKSYCSIWNVICCSESFPENYANEAQCLNECATFTPEQLCCRAFHGSIGGPQRCRFALGVDPGDMPEACR